MSREKSERNRLITTLYNQGKNDREILEALLKAGFDDYKKVKSVTMQLSRLRKAGKIPKERPGRVTKKRRKQQVKKAISPHIDKPTSPLVHKRATFYLTPEIIKSIKQKALDRDLDSSELVREILSEWISGEKEKKRIWE